VKNWKLWAALAAAVLITAAGIYAAYVWWLADPAQTARDGASVARDSQTVVVQRAPLTVQVQAFGVVAVPTRNALTFSMSGKLKEVRVAEGTTVMAGDLLARLDTADLELQAARADAALALSRAQLERAQAKPPDADMQAATEALSAAQARYDRVKAGPLASEVASAEAALQSAQANADELRKGITADERTVLKADVERADIALKQAQAAYDKISWQAGAQGTSQAAALEKATVDYQQAQARYNLALAGPAADQIQRAQAQIAQAQAQLERLKTTGAADELQTAAAQVARARADLDKLKNTPNPQDVAIAQAQVVQAQANLQQVKRQLDDSALVAPVGGTILTLSANVGQWVAAASPVVVLADLSHLQVQVYVHESYISQVHKDQAAQVTLEALPGQRLDAHVSDVAALGSASGYLVTLDLASANAIIKPGMNAEVEIVVAQQEAALAVPKGALRLKDGHWIVRALRNGRVVDVEVKPGLRQGRTVEVLTGLSEGDQVVLDTVSLLKEVR
jgi:HlyD family secretion protein